MAERTGWLMATCTRCGRESAGDARFCPGCGAPLEVAAATDVVGAGTEPALATERAAMWGVDGAAVRVAATDTVYALGAQLAFLFGVAAFVGLALLPSGYHGNPVEWARAAVYLAGMSLRAGLTASPEAGDDESFGAAFAVYAMPLIGTMFGLAAVAFVARRRETADPSADRRVVAARAVLTGARTSSRSRCSRWCGARRRRTAARARTCGSASASARCSSGASCW